MRIYARAVVIAAKDIPDNLTKEQIEEAKDSLCTELNIDADMIHREEDGGFPYEWEQETSNFDPTDLDDSDWEDKRIISYLNAKMDGE